MGIFLEGIQKCQRIIQQLPFSLCSFHRYNSAADCFTVQHSFVNYGTFDV